MCVCVCVCVSVYVHRACTNACYMYNSLAPTLPNTCTLLFMPKYIDLDDFQRVSVLFFFPPYYSQSSHTPRYVLIRHATVLGAFLVSLKILTITVSMILGTTLLSAPSAAQPRRVMVVAAFLIGTRSGCGLMPSSFQPTRLLTKVHCLVSFQV